jgi:multiple sugar transport system ATP-binding protein
MRGELNKIHSTLKTTVVYVTHDQVEAMTLGSRIVIMNNGIIQQVDNPVQVYDNPANVFVAGFIGSPSTNFFDGMVQKEQGKFVFNTSAFKLYLPDHLYDEFEQTKDQECLLGIRPEDILDKKTAEHQKKDFNLHKCEVDFSEILGSENYLHMKMGEFRFIAKVDSHITPVAGDKIEVAFDLRRMHLFDKKTHRVII